MDRWEGVEFPLLKGFQSRVFYSCTLSLLSMDAFAVAVCKGLALPKINLRSLLIVGAWFGGFQALMPLLGWLLGSQFADSIGAYDHWIAFALLAAIGGNMIREALSKDGDKEDETAATPALGVGTMFLMAVATSIDALAVGVTFAFLSVRILPAVALIGVTTFLLSGVGLKVGNLFGTRYKARAELAGGIILVLLGLKILLEHLGILNLSF